ncbi:MAG: U32 family peptidase, partial [Clostridia bacterium]|nr:U32 family peptidase [Clostridia bacterium]
CLHLSTQAGVCNAYGAAYAKELGFSRVVLARETKLADIAEIAKIIETEAFVQGALCTCFSGQCYLSSFAGGNSGNRGKCKQPCRKRYKIDRKGFDEYAYRISLSDLSVGEDIKKLADVGVSSFKIEGRMRRPEYVAAAVSYCKKSLNGTAAATDLSALKRTYNRGNYTKGLAFGQDKSFISSAVQGHIGEYLGTVGVENGKYICRTSVKCSAGDGFKILRDGRELCGALWQENVKGGFCLKSSTRLKNGDKVFITTDGNLNSRLIADKRTLEIELTASFAEGVAPRICLNERVFTARFNAEKAQGRPLTPDEVKRCFDKTDVYPFKINYKKINIDGEVFVPASLLNAFRREVYSRFYSNYARNGLPIIEKTQLLPEKSAPRKNSKTAVIATDLRGVNADIGILKPAAYSGDIYALTEGFAGEKFLYLPPYLSGEDIGRIKPLVSLFDGVYCGGNYSVPLAKELNKKLFAGTGFNLFNYISVSCCPADYVALSKELTVAEVKPLARENAFYLTAGDIAVMDLIYCPFGRSCRDCDKREFYTLTDENGREFTLRRYDSGECRFEIYNCAPLVSRNNFTGALYSLITEESRAADMTDDPERLRKRLTKY